MQVSGHFLPLEYSCCNLLHNCKDKLFTPAFGLIVGQRFCGTLQNLCFSSFTFLLCFGKIASYCYRSLANLSRLLIACIIYFQLTYRPRVALFDVGRLLSYNLYPFGILCQYVNFACAIPLNCDAKVLQIFETYKQFGEKMSIL